MSDKPTTTPPSAEETNQTRPLQSNVSSEEMNASAPSVEADEVVLSENESEEKETTLKNEEPDEQEKASEDGLKGKKKKAKKKLTTGQKIWKWTKRTLITLIIIILLIPILLYIPPIQRLAVNIASDKLSEASGLDIKVEEFHLGFPLDLRMGGVSAIEKGDTILYANELTMSVQFLPLLSGNVKIDNVDLNDVKMNTKQIIESMTLKGNIGSLTLRDNDINMSDKLALLRHADLRHSDLTIIIPDTVPIDTTENSRWKIQFDDFHTEDVKFTLALAPKADSTNVVFNLHKGDLKGVFDLYTTQLKLSKAKMESSSVSYLVGSEMDFTMGFKDMAMHGIIDLDKGVYTLSDMKIGQPDIGLTIGKDMNMGILADDTSLDLKMDLDKSIFDLQQLSMTNANLNLFLDPDVNMSIISDKLKMDGSMNFLTSVYSFTGMKMDEAKLNVGIAEDFNLDMDMAEGSLDTYMDLEHLQFDFPDIQFRQSNVAMQLGQDMDIDLSMDEGGMGLNMDLEHSVFRFNGIQLQQGKVGIGMSDGTSIRSDIGNGSLNSTLDLEKEQYIFSDIIATNSKLDYNTAPGTAAPGFDPSHLSFNPMNANVALLQFNGDGSMIANIRSMRGTERSGLVINDLQGNVTMTDTRMQVEGLRFVTPQSNLRIDYAMDNNAFDPPTRGVRPGQFNLNMDGTLGKGDLALFLGNTAPGFTAGWPNAPLRMKAVAKGNLQQLDVSQFEAHIPGAMDVKGNLTATGLDSGNMTAKTSFTANIPNTAFLASILPSDMMADFNLPSSINLTADASYGPSGIYAKAYGNVGGTVVDIDGGIGLDSEDYDFVANLNHFNLRDFLPTGSAIELDGYVAAKGHGFNPFKTSTYCNATFNVNHVRYDDYSFEDINGYANLKECNLDANVSVNDPKLKTTLAVDGVFRTDKLDANATLNLDYLNLATLGFSDDRLEVSTRGDFFIKSDLDHLLDAKAHIAGLNLLIGTDSLHTDALDITAITTNDTTDFRLYSGDFHLSVYAPDNLMSVVERYQDMGTTAAKFAKAHKLNINFLKRHMPTATIETEIGKKNIFSELLATKDITFDKASLQLSTSPEAGIQGFAHMSNFMSDSLMVKNATVEIAQDTTVIDFNAKLDLPNQPMFPGFDATLDGYLKSDEVQVHLKQYDKKGKMGMDVGMHVNAVDSMLVGKLLPEEPTLAYMKFKANTDNQLMLDTLNRLHVNLDLESLTDSCKIKLYANPTDATQDINAVISNLNLAHISDIVPSISPMEGNLNMNATYREVGKVTDISGKAHLDKFVFDGTNVGNVSADFDYKPEGDDIHKVTAHLTHETLCVVDVNGTYDSGEKGGIDARVKVQEFPMALTAPFIPDQFVTLGGKLNGNLHLKGTSDKFVVNGSLNPDNIVANSDIYSVNLRLENKPIPIQNGRISFNDYLIYGSGSEPLHLRGWYDLSDLEDMYMNLTLNGNNFSLMDSPRGRKSMVFGKVLGDFFLRLNGSFSNLHVRGVINILPATDVTYLMTNTPLSIDYRLSDIVTFVDSSQPPAEVKREAPVFSGLDMTMSLSIGNGAQLHCEFSADKQSYIDVEGEGDFNMTYTQTGNISLLGRYTIDEGKMKYTLPVIPLKTFSITPGSYVEFTGNPTNPTINFAATEEMTSSVSDNSGSRTVKFDTGLEVKGTLSDMQLLFTIDAPEDMQIKNELTSMSVEERNKLAVAMLCTGMYMAASNSSSFDANNALNNFLQNEINNIAGKALNTVVDVNMGVEQSTRDDGTTRTDYSFKFSRRFFNNRLNVIVGGKVSNGDGSVENESGAYIDDVSLEWRLNEGGTRYVRLFHEKNYENLFEGEVISNGASYIFRKKLNKLTDLWKKRVKSEK